MIDETLHDTEQLTTTVEWAAFEFEPVAPEDLRTAPTSADWMKMTQSHLVALSHTWKILGATKEDLKKFVREKGDDVGLIELLKSLASAKILLSALDTRRALPKRGLFAPARQ
jgi:hypothetical protein